MDTPKRLTLKCAECSAPVTAKHPDAAFCGPRCRQAWHRRQASRGQVLTPVAMTWRGARNRKGDAEVGKDAMREMCRLMDRWAAEDREAGRTAVMAVGKRRAARNGDIAKA